VTSEPDRRHLKVGVIGTGWIGRQHAEMVSRRDDAAVVAVCDLDRRLASEVAAKTGGEVYSDWRELLAEAPVDAVFVCTPPATHAEPAIAALRQGVPLYLEKPIARDLHPPPPSSRRLPRLAWCAPSATSGMPSTLSTRRAGAQRPSGRLRHRGEHRGDGVPAVVSRPCPGRREPARSAAAHHIDLVRAVAGEVVSVQAAATSVRLSPRPAGAGDIDDGVTLLLHLAGGGLATIIVAWTSDDLPGSYWLQLIADGAALRSSSTRLSH